MNGRDFYDQINDNEDFEWIGVPNIPDTTEVLIRYKPRDAKFALDVAAIKEHSWDVLRDVLTLQRDPVIMEKVTRIVGYYSMLQNWNKSKIAELNDRHKGDYTLHNEAPDLKSTLIAGAA